MYTTRFASVCRLRSLVSAGGAAAQPAIATAPPAASLTTTAVRAAEAPVIDGDVAGDPAWANATPITAFWQEQPDEGQPSSERTEVRVIFTADTLYIGAILFDREPGGIVVSDARRDAPMTDTDSFQMIVDTYRDRQNGFVFGTNPAGIEYDGQVTNEGEGGGGLGVGQMQSGGAGVGLQHQLGRRVDRAHEDHRAGLDRGVCHSVPHAALSVRDRSDLGHQLPAQHPAPQRARLLGADSPAVQPVSRCRWPVRWPACRRPALRNLRITPYALGNALASGIKPVDSELLGEVGGDLKYSLTPSLTLDATVNTDFAQVEVDDQQVNLDRFTLFFPEKRPFFLENAGFFTVGNPGEVDLFFSRRIGISDAGQAIPILGGGRVSGKAGKFNVGVLNMQTDDFEDRVASTNFSVARVSRDLPNRSSLGAIFTNRQGVGRSARATPIPAALSAWTASGALGRRR